MRQRLHLPPKLDGSIWQYTGLASANRRHTHPELELNLVTRGAGMYLLGSHRYQIRRGDLLWLFPAQEHVLIEQTSEFGMWIAVFRRRAIRRVATDPFARPLLKAAPPRETCRRLDSRNAQRLEDLLAEITPGSEPDSINPGLINAGLAYALLHAWQSFQNAAAIPVCDLHPAVERASRLIRNGEAPESLDDLSHLVGLSTARLSRLFHAQTGSTLVNFRNRQRIERFLEIYGAGRRHTMLEAALEAGFGSYPQFHRVFTRVMGSSPASHRRENS